MKPARYLLVGGLLLVLSAALRFYQLGDENFWIDEFHTFKQAHRTLDLMLERNWNHPPLYFLMIREWVKAFGAGEFALRFPSLIFGCAGLVFVTLGARRLADRRTALIAALLIAISAFQIHYGQEARPYALYMLFSAIALFAFVRTLERPTFANSALLVAANVAAIYTHFYGIFLVLGQNVCFFAVHFGAARFGGSRSWALSNAESDGPSSDAGGAPGAGTPADPPGLGHWIVIQLVVLAAFLPWLGRFVVDVETHQDKRPDYPPPPLTKLVGPFVTYSGSFLQLALYGLLAAVPVLTRFDKRVFLLLCWIFTSIFVPFVGAHLLMPQAYVTRYTIGASIAFYILVARGIRLLPAPRLRTAAIAVVLILAAVDLRAYYAAENRAPWREATATIAERYEPGDRIIIHPSMVRGIFEHYWPNEELRIEPFPPATSFYFEHLLDSLETAVRDIDRFWYVESYSRDPKGLILERLDRNHAIAFERRWDIENEAMGKRVSIEARLLVSEGAR